MPGAKFALQLKIDQRIDAIAIAHPIDLRFGCGRPQLEVLVQRFLLRQNLAEHMTPGAGALDIHSLVGHVFDDRVL